MDQALLSLSLFSLSSWDFSVAADVTRAVLKKQGSAADAGVWIMRGLSFLGIGEMKLILRSLD